eukprot:scaffold37865_cov40-Attheya_sp.AAC.1
MYFNCISVAYSTYVPVEPIYVPVPGTTDRFLGLGAPARTDTECYARLPDKVMIFRYKSNLVLMG